jgi:hypothetical protein
MKDVLLNWKKISKFLGEKRYDNEIRGYSHEEIKRMLEFADIKYRAVIFLYATTGMRREALTDLHIRDLEYLDKYQIYKITVYKKTKEQHVCFTTPEAAEAISLYIKGKDPEEYFHDVAPKSVSIHLRDIVVEAGIGKKHEMTKNEIHGQFRDNTAAVHSLRKFNITQMARAKVDTEIAKLLTGHSIGVRSRYLNYSDDDLLQEYTKAIPFLTISNENKLSHELKNLAIKNQGFVNSVDSKLKEKDEEVRKLEEQIAAIQKEQREGKEYFKSVIEKMTKEKFDIKLLDGTKYITLKGADNKKFNQIMRKARTAVYHQTKVKKEKVNVG